MAEAYQEEAATEERGDDYGLDRPADLRRTLRRLRASVSHQRLRLRLVLLSASEYAKALSESSTNPDSVL